MRFLFRIVTAASLAVFFLASAQVLEANCSTARAVSSTSPQGVSYIYTPGNPFDGPHHPYAPGSPYGYTTTYSLRGSFWSFGAGDPATGSGNDCGSQCGLGLYSDWLHVGFVGQNRTFLGGALGHWGNSLVDGCIDDDGSEPFSIDSNECTVVLLSDQDFTGGAWFAILATNPTPNGDFFFIQGVDDPIDLVTVPVPTINTSSAVSANEVEIHVTVPDTAGPNDGKYLECSAAQNSGILQGYKIVASPTPPGGEAPVSRLRCTADTQECLHLLPSEAWVDLPMTDLLGNPLPHAPLGQETRVRATCSGAADIYVATVLVFDSGFEIPNVSANSQPVPCGVCTGADSDGDGFCSGDAVPDCNDSDATVHPGAPQLCDGKNNDCNDPTWPNVPSDETDTDGDSYAPCAGDCDDGSPSVNPNRPEACNAGDDNCNGLVDENESGMDSDGDGVPSACDNCAFVANSDQTDADEDGTGDACDACAGTEPGDSTGADGCSVCLPDGDDESDDEESDDDGGDDEEDDGDGDDDPDGGAPIIIGSPEVESESGGSTGRQEVQLDPNPSGQQAGPAGSGQRAPEATPRRPAPRRRSRGL